MNRQNIEDRKVRIGIARMRRVTSRLSEEEILETAIKIVRQGLWRNSGFARIEDFLSAGMGIRGATLTNLVELLKQKGVYDENANN